MALPSLFIWGGPVFADTPSKVAWTTDVQALVLSHGPNGGISSGAFSQLAESLKGPDGRILPQILAQAKLNRADFDKVVIGGFSAFHGLAAPLLDADADEISACICLDACFSDPSKVVKQGYRKFAAKAARGDALFVFTASSGGGVGSGATIGPDIPDFTTGYDCAWANAEAGAADAGVTLEPYTPPDTVPPTNKGSAKRANGLIVLDYRDEYWHGDHVNKFGIQVLDTYLAPYVAGDFSVGAGGGTRWLGFAAGVALGLGLAVMLGD